MIKDVARTMTGDSIASSVIPKMWNIVMIHVAVFYSLPLPSLSDNSPFFLFSGPFFISSLLRLPTLSVIPSEICHQALRFL